MNGKTEELTALQSGSLELQPQPRKQGFALTALIWDNGIVCMALTAAIFAFSAFSVKLIRGRLSVFEIVAVRSIASLLLTLPSIHHLKQQDSSGQLSYVGHRENWPNLLARGVFGAAAMTLYYFSVNLLPLGDAVTVFFTNVVATAVIAVAFGYERVSVWMLLGCAACIGGVTLLAHPPFLFGGGMWSVTRLLGIGTGLLSAACAAGAFIAIKSLGQREQPITMSLWFHGIAGVSALVPMLVSSWPTPPVVPTPREGLLLLNVVWTSFCGQLLLSRGFQLLRPSSAASINLTQVVHARVLSTLFLHDDLHWYSIVGSLLTGLGVLLSQFGKGASSGEDDNTVPSRLELAPSSDLAPFSTATSDAVLVFEEVARGGSLGCEYAITKTDVSKL